MEEQMSYGQIGTDRHFEPQATRTKESYTRQNDPQIWRQYSTDRSQGHGYEAGVATHAHGKQMPPITAYEFTMIQEPVQVEALESVDKSPKSKNGQRKKTTWPIEPMPVIEVKVMGEGGAKPHPLINVHPSMFAYARLYALDDNRGVVEAHELQGNCAASVFQAKQHGYMFFPDLNVKYPGNYYLEFTLVENVVDQPRSNCYAVPVGLIRSRSFTVLPRGYQLPPALRPTDINKILESAGAKLRYRKPIPEKRRKEDDWGSSLADLRRVSVGANIGNRHKGRKSQQDAPAEGVLTTLPTTNPPVSGFPFAFANTSQPMTFASQPQTSSNNTYAWANSGIPVSNADQPSVRMPITGSWSNNQQEMFSSSDDSDEMILANRYAAHERSQINSGLANLQIELNPMNIGLAEHHHLNTLVPHQQERPILNLPFQQPQIQYQNPMNFANSQLQYNQQYNHSEPQFNQSFDAYQMDQDPWYQR
ncbi:velum formation- protein [Lithohypha guttulata]|uniref:Velum formation- protein n=1 Tax=Lithohypha guttulata TaxID=1690604 RepID=A0AAN7T223_9EURO|nr:velum formation- protein [Lithohypha guttulata]